MYADKPHSKYFFGGKFELSMSRPAARGVYYESANRKYFCHHRGLMGKTPELGWWV